MWRAMMITKLAIIRLLIHLFHLKTNPPEKGGVLWLPCGTVKAVHEVGSSKQLLPGWLWYAEWIRKEALTMDSPIMVATLVLQAVMHWMKSSCKQYIWLLCGQVAWGSISEYWESFWSWLLMGRVHEFGKNLWSWRRRYSWEKVCYHWDLWDVRTGCSCITVFPFCNDNLHCRTVVWIGWCSATSPTSGRQAKSWNTKSDDSFMAAEPMNATQT